MNASQRRAATGPLGGAGPKGATLGTPVPVRLCAQRSASLYVHAVPRARREPSEHERASSGRSADNSDGP